MKFCTVVPEICRGQVHGARKERIIIIIIIIRRRNGAKTISLQTLFGRLNKKRWKNNKSPKLCLGDLIIIRNGAKTVSLQTLFGRLNNWMVVWLEFYFLFIQFPPNFKRTGFAYIFFFLLSILCVIFFFWVQFCYPILLFLARP